MSLSKTSLGMAQIVGQSLATKGVELSAQPNTPVAVLTDLSQQQLILEENKRFAEGGFESPNVTTLLLEGSDTPAPGSIESEHSGQLGEMVQLLCRGLNGTLDMTQNVVVPMIERLHESVVAELEAVLKATVSPLEIVQQRPDPIFDSVYLQESTARYVNQPREVRLKSLGLVCGDVFARLETGHAGMDQQLKEFLGRVGEDFATSVWNSIFGSAPATSMDVFARPTQANAAVLVYFFAARAGQDAPAGANIDLSEWRAYCAELLAAAGASIVASYNDRNLTRKFGRLVLSYPTEPTPLGQVVVDGEKYVEWLAQGGSPELIFATVYGDRQFDPARMIERKVSLLEAWEREMALFQNTVNYKRYEAAVQGVRAGLSKEVTALKDEEVAGGDRGAYHDRIRTFAHAVKLGDLEDLWQFCRRAVCQVMFPHTDAESLLLSMQEQAKLRPETDPRELATYATIELVARWLCDQFTVKAHLPL